MSKLKLICLSNKTVSNIVVINTKYYKDESTSKVLEKPLNFGIAI